MAKQIGIHQIKGKIEGRSYYRQSGVETGLSRSINQGLSGRVKNSAEYANTRLNNQEFKRANALATAAFRSVFPSWRSMYRRFAVALMTKRFLELIKAGSGTWGNRYPDVELGGAFQDILLNHAKNGEYQDQFGHITKSFEHEKVNFDGDDVEIYVPRMSMQISTSDAAPIIAQGIDGLNIYCRTAYVSCDEDVHVAMSLPKLITNRYPYGSDAEPMTVDEEAELLDSTTVIGTTFTKEKILTAENAGVYLVFVLVPYRRIGGTNHELQELATYEILGSKLVV